MMRDYLAIQSINVICEQIFSVTENIIIKIQNRLYLETAKHYYIQKARLIIILVKF
ncbi:hypothetical protein RIR_e6305_A0A2N0RUZ2_9GLOM [Rhizophagus irregularis DAOM 181602=DAOM 197198]|nr:hypothetical protein RIR_e6305_A0A2N0RUZ2_9GLOM [Rhizophagus irregularis DAOM 181602=DAOM 197198]